jgi:hypothetical protein
MSSSLLLVSSIELGAGRAGKLSGSLMGCLKDLQGLTGQVLDVIPARSPSLVLSSSKLFSEQYRSRKTIIFMFRDLFECTNDLLVP